MLPIPSLPARLTFLGSTLAAMLGIALSNPAAFGLGASGLLLLAWALVRTLPLGRVARRDGLEFAWWLDRSRGRADSVLGAHSSFAIRCYIRHQARAPIRLQRLRAITWSAVDCEISERDMLTVPAGRQVEFIFAVRSHSVGRVVLHGLTAHAAGPLGLFEVPLYFANPLGLRILPRSVARVPLPRGRKTQLGTFARPGRARIHRRGGGTEFFELRDFQPGDPYRAIAWKASAKAGSLMVREVEEAVQQTLHWVVDVGPRMREGTPGHRGLDLAIDLVAAEAKRSVLQGDRVGVLTADRRILGQVRPDDRSAQLIRILDILLAATEVVDRDLTEISDPELLRRVAHYLRYQDGQDFSSISPRHPIDVARLASYVTGLLPKEGSWQESSGPGPRLREFCRIRGLPLPYRQVSADIRPDVGLIRALNQVNTWGRTGASWVFVVSEPGPQPPSPEMLAALRGLRRHGHQVVWVAPLTAANASAPREAVAMWREQLRPLDIHLATELQRPGPVGGRPRVERASRAA